MKKTFLLLLAIFINVTQAFAMPENGIVDALIKLDLSKDQKSEIATILKNSRTQIRPQVDALIVARKKLRVAIQEENYSEQSVRSASKEIARVQEELAVLRAHTVNKVMKVLTAEQKKTVHEMRAEAGEKIGKKIAGFRKLLNFWIDKNANS